MSTEKQEDTPKWQKAFAFLFGSGPWEPVQRKYWWGYLPLSLFLGSPYGVYLAVFKDHVAIPTLCFLLWVVLSFARHSLLGTSLLFGAGSAYLFVLGIRLKINKMGTVLLPFILVFSAIFYFGWRQVWWRAF